MYFSTTFRKKPSKIESSKEKIEVACRHYKLSEIVAETKTLLALCFPDRPVPSLRSSSPEGGPVATGAVVTCTSLSPARLIRSAISVSRWPCSKTKRTGGRRPRPFRPFRSHEEYLYAMKEDLAEWLQNLYDLPITADDFMDKLETGVALCRHANRVITAAKRRGRTLGEECRGDVVYRPEVQPGTFHARDNVHNFIAFCRKGLRIKECLLFETDDLVMRKNEKNVVLCLLEVARRGTKFGMPAPLLVQMEREIDAEIAAHRDDSNEENRTPPSSLSLRGDSDEGHEADDDSESEPLATPRQPQAPQPQIVTNDLRSLHERNLEITKPKPNRIPIRSAEPNSSFCDRFTVK
ncbi:GAS2-like protein pickled eggs [Caerostris darwini]|uniref:GAS2-like protein pickled eggs n=1 Tax=Caerostris darwini TaxID=1538125 RepID=A0AAV4W9J4_9ARAC|nr:GAS2-like protein pickled eggs [Caerostris darwini]